jgi:hypothetical protein
MGKQAQGLDSLFLKFRFSASSASGEDDGELAPAEPFLFSEEDQFFE